MPLDPHAKRLLDMLALGADPDAPPPDAAARRLAFKALMGMRPVSVPMDAVVEDVIDRRPGPAIPVRCYTPLHAGDERLPGLVFFHGGGLVAGDLDTHDALCRSLASEGRCRLIAVGYRLAPEHPFPAAVEDAAVAVSAVANGAARWNIDPARVAVAGDSAGGTLAILAATAARDAALPALRFQLLLCPVLDLAGRSPSRLRFGRGYMLDEAVIFRDLADYLPARVSPEDPRVSPLRAAVLRGLPPTLLHTAEFDPLRDEGADYAARLAASGVAVHQTCHLGMIHHFIGLAGVLPYAKAALHEIGLEIRRAFT